MCKFWWSTNASKDKCIHWMCWSRLCSTKADGGMSFRCLRDFNLALYGKQAWRLVLYPNKLVSQVYKARYYPSGTFLAATIGSNPSYIWRSVLETQNLIKSGMSCRVGNGEEVAILNTPWLPVISDPYVHSNSEALFNKKVSSLMKTREKVWDEDLIVDLFTARDVAIILSIPLSDDDRDTWYWRHEKMGHYSVKSAYIVIQETKTHSHTAANSGFWRKLWNLKIPPKVKNFLWRAAANCLPTKDLLKR